MKILGTKNVNRSKFVMVSNSFQNPGNHFSENIPRRSEWPTVKKFSFAMPLLNKY